MLKNKILNSIIIFSVIFSLVLYNGACSLYAADSVTSLPANVNLNVEREGNILHVTYEGMTCNIDLDQKIVSSPGSSIYYNTYYSFGGSSSSYSYYSSNIANVPYSLIGSGTGAPINCSIWFSPTYMDFFVFLSFSSGGKPTSYIKACNYADGRFYSQRLIDGVNQRMLIYTIPFINRYDRNGNLKHVAGKILTSGSTSYANTYINVDSTSYILGTNATYVWSKSNYQYEYTTNSSGGVAYAPKDCLCVFSNYEIPGFYEFDTSNVVTPDYYFQYQYLFYREGLGYFFLDSSSPIQARYKYGDYYEIDFVKTANCFYYVSTNGLDWQINSSALFLRDYIMLSTDKKYFVDDAGNDVSKLVFTTDDDYSGSQYYWSDIDEYLDTPYNPYNYFPIVINHHDKDTPQADLFWNFLRNDLGISDVYSYLSLYTIAKQLSVEGPQDFFIPSMADIDSATGYTGFSFDKVTGVSLRQLIIDLLYSNESSNYYLSYLNINLKNIFDVLVADSEVISKVPGKLTSILTAINSLDFDFSFDDSGIIAAINNISFNSSDTTNNTTNINNIMTELNAIVGINNNILTALNNMQFLNTGDLNVALDPIIKGIDNLDLSPEIELPDIKVDGFDDTYLAHLDNDMHGLVAKLDNDFELSDVFQNQTLTFINNGYAKLLDGSVIPQEVVLDNGVVAGVGFLNGMVTELFNSNTKMKPVILLSLSLPVVGLVMRKEY